MQLTLSPARLRFRLKKAELDTLLHDGRLTDTIQLTDSASAHISVTIKIDSTLTLPLHMSMSHPTAIILSVSPSAALELHSNFPQKDGITQPRKSPLPSLLLDIDVRREKK